MANGAGRSGWVKSSFSAANLACVEFAQQGDGIVALRDSKQPEIHLHYTCAEIDAFIRGAKNGDFDFLLDG